ncbi:hypothetical protein [Pseudogemmobacter bohemicus]|uniref:hypothetical protein n=1 Tax=Pseudogemmobacter bohemicus TaxID=2250708 RepID=UPI000DD3E81D|nr:hypothetical protein [Pseudogemmobacter bohemicus]
MRSIIALAALALVAGCVDPMGVDPSSNISLITGTGVAAVDQNGTRSFRYVFPPHAGSDKAHHNAMIAQWAAKPEGCPRGYTVAKVEGFQGGLVYSGPCR